MTYSQLIKKFIVLEEREGFFEYQIRSRIVWDYLRYVIFEYVLVRQVARDNEINLSPQVGCSSRLRDMRGVGRAMIQPILKPFKPRQRTYDLMVINYDRKNFIDGKVANIHFYPFIKELKDRYRILLVDPSRYEERVEENYKCDVFRSRVLHFRAKLRAKFVRYSNEERVI